MPCNPNEPSDNVKRHIGSLISASSGNRYTRVEAVMSSSYIPFLEAGSVTEEWIGLYEPAGQLGQVRFGFRYRPGSTVVFAEFKDQGGNIEEVTDTVPAGSYRFAIKWSDDPAPGSELDVFLATELFAERDMQFTPTRALLYGNTSNRGNEVLGYENLRSIWNLARYQRNFGAFIDWPAGAATTNNFGAARASLVVADGLQTVYDKSALCS